MNTNETLNYMLSLLPDKYDVSEGSFFYDILYPVAERISEFYNNLLSLEDNAFAVTAQDEYLDRKVAEQGITRRSATYATGVVRIYGNRGEIIRSGTKVAADNILFAVNETYAIPEEGFADVAVTCMSDGDNGNVRAGEIDRFPVTLPGLTSVVNEEAMSGGYDAENDYDLLERYLEKVSRPNVSGNKNHYIEWAKEVTGVGSVRVLPLWNGAGTVKVIITDTDNHPASDELIESVRDYIEENRPIGADVTVESAASMSIDISAKLISSGADTIMADIETAADEYLSAVALNKTYVSYAHIGKLILSVDGVDDYLDLKVNGGTVNIELPDGTIPVLGRVVIV